MPLLGAHMSIEGGVSKALDRGKEACCDAIQIFTKNNNQWKSKPLLPDEIKIWQDNINKTNVKPIASHDSYLINLASPKKDVYAQSLDAFCDEIDRAEALAIPYLVFHPGSRLFDTETNGIKRIANSINIILSKKSKINLTLLFETTAGQGSQLGYKFDQLGKIIELIKRKDKIGVCVDTCHIFAAGYNISVESGYIKTFEEFDKIIGLDRIKLFHLNDSKRELASRVDRHEHIGKGKLTLDAFKFLLSDKRFQNLPMILETPKGKNMKEDKINLKILRSLISI
jgi:deoxyribonuclease-4